LVDHAVGAHRDRPQETAMKAFFTHGFAAVL
jgi:hypothetical protein